MGRYILRQGMLFSWRGPGGKNPWRGWWVPRGGGSVLGQTAWCHKIVYEAN